MTSGPGYCGFLILVWIAFWRLLQKKEPRLRFLATTSLIYIGNLDFALAIGLLTLSYIIFWGARKLSEAEGRLSPRLFISTPLILLIYFKGIVVPLSEHYDYFREVSIPLGLSYFTFKQIHYLIESSRGNIKRHSFSEFLTYIVFFPSFTSGPIERFPGFSSQTDGLTLSKRDISEALERILIGYLKKVLLVEAVLAPLSSFQIMLAPGPSPGPVSEWALLSAPWYAVLWAGFILFLKTYFDFSAYSDIALGTGRLFGFRLMENFNFPLLRPNIAEFWRAWHMSLSSWVRDYVYFPLLLRFRKTQLALIVAMLAMGAWHALTPIWLVWGLHHGLGMAFLATFQRRAERYPLIQKLRSSFGWRLASVGMVWWYVSLGYILTYVPFENAFHNSDFGHSMRLYIRVISFGVFG